LVELALVAAPCHPLAQATQSILVSEAREHTQLVLTDRSRLTEGQTFGLYGTRVWKLGDLGAKHRLLLAGLGWGSMPCHLVEADLQAVRLVRIELADRRSVHYNGTWHANRCPERAVQAGLTLQIAMNQQFHEPGTRVEFPREAMSGK
jgi:DNA-binding transcriptional LysR family regulator